MANSPPAIKEAVALVRKQTGLAVDYQGGAWYVWKTSSNASRRVRATAEQTKAFNAQLEAIEARLNPPAPTGSNWWERAKFGTTDGGGIAGSNWMQRAAFSPQTLMRGSLAGAAMFNVHQSAQSGGQAATAVAEGASSVVNGAFSAGAKIGQAVLDGALRPFGASGQALSGFSVEVTQTLQKGLSGGLSGLSKIIGAGGQAAGLGIGLAGAGVGALAGGALGLAGAGVGAVPGAFVGSLIGVAFLKITEAISQMVGGVLSTVGEALGTLGDLAAGAFRTALEVVRDLTDSVLKLSNAAVGLSQRSGMGIGAAATASNLMAGFGIRQEDMPGFARNTFLQSTLRRAFGLRGETGSVEDLASFRNIYRQQAAKGPIGLMMAQNMAKAVGYEGAIGMANLPDNIFQRQIQRSQSLQTSFGMSPEQMLEAAQNWNSLTATVTQGIELIKSKFAIELLPFLIEKLDAGIAWVSAHSGEIVAGIKRGVSWLTNDLPTLLAQGAEIGLRGAQSFLKGLEGAGHGFAEMLRVFESGQGAFFGIISGAALFFDTMTEGLRNMIAMGSVAAALASNAWEFSKPGMAYNAAFNRRGPIYTDPVMAAAQSFADTQKYQTDLSGALLNLQSSGQMGDWAKRIDAGANRVGAFADGTLNDYIDATGNWIAGRSESNAVQPRQSDEVAELLRALLAVLQGVEGNTRDMDRALGNYRKQTINEILTGQRLARSRA